jgi:CRISPR/Cas system-associated endoribonuclease Cas2
MIYLGILIGLIIGLPIGFIKWKKNPVVEKYSRRGLLHKQYSVFDGSTGRKSTIECVFEVGELESTDTLSKIEVIDLKPNQSQYNTDHEKKRLTDMVNNTWVNSKDITWITTAVDVRNKKIDEILN